MVVIRDCRSSPPNSLNSGLEKNSNSPQVLDCILEDSIFEKCLEIGILLSDHFHDGLPEKLGISRKTRQFGFKFQVPSSFSELPANNRFLLLGCSSYWTTDFSESTTTRGFYKTHHHSTYVLAWSDHEKSLAMPSSSLFRSPGTSLKPISFNPRWRCFGAKKNVWPATSTNDTLTL